MKQKKKYVLLFLYSLIFAIGRISAQASNPEDAGIKPFVKDPTITSGQVTTSFSDTVADEKNYTDRQFSEKKIVSENRIDEKKTNEDLSYRPIGSAGVEVGQIASGYWKKPAQSISSIAHVWQEKASCSFGYNVLYKKNLDINMLCGGLLAYSTPQVNGAPQTQQTRYFFSIKNASAAYSYVDNGKFKFNVQLGYFPFKYNPDVRNLGEYLFRTNAYPLLVYSEFDSPQADILGLKLNFRYNHGDVFSINNDLLFHSELYSIPVQDWSLSDVFSATLFKAFALGGGISFCNLLSVYQGTYNTDIWLEYQYYKKYYMVVNGDSTVFDWKSTKVMARASWDPKITFPEHLFGIPFIPTNIFGNNDWKMYGEAAVIGLKNYPYYFTDMRDRTFYSIGFNFPGFKFFDVISGELEYCRDTSAFSDEGLYTIANSSKYTILKERDLNESSTLSYKVKRDPFRWSIYVKKSVLDGHVTFVGQCARDHKKINFYYYQYEYMSYIETLPSKNDWWWSFKTEFNF